MMLLPFPLSNKRSKSNYNPIALNQPPLSGNGSNALSGRHIHPTLSPDSDSDSDSDISLGTHSPIPSMTSQHSPNSSSGLNDRDLDRLAEEHRDPRGEKDYRNFASLQSFRFGEHINVAGFTNAFNRQFLPGLPYRLGDNASPTHSPPIGTTLSSAQTGTSATMAQNPPNYNLPAGLIRPQPQMPQSAAMAAMIACVANGQSNGSQQTLLQHHLNQSQSSAQVSPLRIRVNSPTRINSTSSSQSSNDVVITTTSVGSPTIPGATQIPPQTHSMILNGGHLARMSHMSHLHRPFESSSPKPKEAS
ncbi:CLUMA_CG005254, isoform A [Clunio marinus]|uniref:CLUMA_CG005254, isoform A n=1 Tax=Clunio marinus TaxID=568069 RepID=A0A1J1HU50_9DIPT|nr:CLUMA_CG005254, isoform A [Clunio marinus]